MLRNIKEVFSDTFYYGLSSVIGQLAGLILVPFYTDVLSPEEYGIIAIFALTLAFFQPLVSLGLESALFRYFSMSDSNNEKTSLFSSAVLFKLIYVFCFVIFLIPFEELINNLIFENKLTSDLYYILLITLLFENLISLGFVILRVQRKVFSIFIINISVLVVGLFFSIWLVLILKWGVKGVFISGLITSLIRMILYYYYVHSNIIFNKFNFSNLKKLFNYGLPLVPHKFIHQLFNLFVLFLINEQLGLIVAGLYVVSRKFSKPLSFIVSMVQMAWAPYKFDIHKKEKNKATLFKNLISFYWILIISLWSLFSIISLHLFKLLINEQYWEGIIYTPFIMLVPVFQAIYFTLPAGYELHKNQSYASLSSFIAFLFMISFAYIFFNFYQPFNFILIHCLSILLGSIILYKYARSIIKIKFPFKFIIPFFIICLSLVYFAYNLDDIFISICFFTAQIFLSLILIRRILGLENMPSFNRNFLNNG